MSLKELQDNVEADAALHLPDIYYDINSTHHSVEFMSVMMSVLYDKDEKDVAGLKITTDRQEADKTESAMYLFSRWSRSQLLSLFGTREKWFSLVSLEQQVSELNARVHGFMSYRIRIMKALDGFPVRLVRGLVSSEYTEIKNTEVMTAVIDKASPDSKVLRYYSGLTDRAFYAYIMSPFPITIPGTSFYGYPGVIVKNSEVGYTSLWVTPTIVMKQFNVPVIIEHAHVLKRIHRGKANLIDLFEKAFADCAVIWNDISKQVPALVMKQYVDADAAVLAMRQMIESDKRSDKNFTTQCVDIYKSKPRMNTALDIFECITEACATYSDRDQAYEVGAIAGAVLYKLLH